MGGRSREGRLRHSMGEAGSVGGSGDSADTPCCSSNALSLRRSNSTGASLSPGPQIPSVMRIAGNILDGGSNATLSQLVSTLSGLLLGLQRSFPFSLGLPRATGLGPAGVGSWEGSLPSASWGTGLRFPPLRIQGGILQDGGGISLQKRQGGHWDSTLLWPKFSGTGE